MSSPRAVLVPLSAVLLGLACDPAPPADTGGYDFPLVVGEDGAACGRALGVVLTDYTSSSVALLDFEGTTRSATFVSSGSRAPALSAALGGDVVFPSERPPRLVVLLDRFPAALLTFHDLGTGEVTGQLDVGQGFASNPQDYLELGARRALVSRYGQNPTPGDEPLDGGSDVLVVDPETGALLESISLSAHVEPGFLPRPAALRRALGHPLVTLSGYDARFTDAADARLVLLDEGGHEALESLTLRGLKNCGALSVSPDERELALSCAGLVDGSDQAAPGDAGIVRVGLDLEARERGEPALRELWRSVASDEALGPAGPSLDYPSAGLLLTTRYGAVEGQDAGRPDRLVVHDLEAGSSSVLLESVEPFTLGSVRCVPACGLCFAADAGRGVIHRFVVRGAELTEHSEHEVDESTGLPPRQLGLL